MMNEFQVKFREAIFEDDVYLRPVEILEDEEDLIIFFSVFLYDTTQEVQRWRVKCRNLLDYNLVLDFIEDIDVLNKHVLLWEYQQNHSELYFGDLPKNGDDLIGKLLKKHNEFTQGWIKFEYFLNKESKWIFDSSQGLLASGPELIINEYNRVFRDHGIKTSLISSKKQIKECSVMIFGRSFIVAERFEFDLVMEL
jgi:hypothetical protein